MADVCEHCGKKARTYKEGKKTVVECFPTMIIGRTDSSKGFMGQFNHLLNPINKPKKLCPACQKKEWEENKGKL